MQYNTGMNNPSTSILPLVTKEWRDLIGNTPLVKIERLFAGSGINVFAKLESFNLGGSIKDRSALLMLEQALHEGKIKKGTTIIESSSGNMGIGLAQICLRYGFHFIAIVDPHTTTANISIMKALGATIDMVDWHGKTTGSFLESRFGRVNQLLKEVPESYWPNQYANENNAKAHRKTMQEIDDALNGNVDYVYCATSTCGTLRGCSDFIKQHRRNTKIIAVDAEGSVIFGRNAGKRLIPGHGSAVRSSLCRDGMADQVVYVNDKECVDGCKLLLQKEAIFAGGSSGAIVSAMVKTITTIPSGSNIVMILPDRGDRYLDTIYNPEWVRSNLGGIPRNT